MKHVGSCVGIGLLGLVFALGCGGGGSASGGGEASGEESTGGETSGEESTGGETGETEESGGEETGEETGGGGVCEPGSELVCQCPDQSPGLITCLPNGTGYTECACGEEPLLCEPGSSLECACPGDPQEGPWEGLGSDFKWIWEVFWM